MKIPPEARSAFLVCTFSMLGKIASADGAITTQERKKVERFAVEELELDKKTLQTALELFDAAADSPLELRDYADKFATSLPDRIALRDQVVETLLTVSAADGILHPDEAKLLRSAALLLGLSEAAYDRMKDKAFAD